MKGAQCMVVMQSASNAVARRYGRLNVLLNVAGVLHIPDVLAPGKHPCGCSTLELVFCDSSAQNNFVCLTVVKRLRSCSVM